MLDECNDIAADLLLLSLLEDVAVGEAEPEFDVVILVLGTAVYTCPPNEVVTPVGARVMTGPGALIMVMVAPSVVMTLVMTEALLVEVSSPPSSVLV